MSDERLDAIEALLAELDVEDLEPVLPPIALRTAVERQVADIAGGGVRSIAARRRFVGPWVLAAAATLTLVIAGAIVVFGDDASDPVVSAAVLTFDSASFDPRGADATAHARLLIRDGVYSIELADTQFPQLGDDDLELWLIEPDEAGVPVDVAPVSLIDDDGDGVYEVPAGLDPSSHFVVDISIEPRDGDAAHSGHSILRGALQQS